MHKQFSYRSVLLFILYYTEVILQVFLFKTIFKYFFYLLISFHKISTCEHIKIYICRQSGKDYYLGLGIAGPYPQLR